jgi:DNA-binding response OmpR family regulator
MTMKLRVLIVEDNEDRMEIFDKVFEHDKTWRALDAPTGVDLVRERSFDLVMLDRDLGPGGVGEDVARAICALPELQQPFVVVHSWNPDGARRIAEILHEGGVRFMCRMFDANIGLYVHSVRRNLETQRGRAVTVHPEFMHGLRIGVLMSIVAFGLAALLWFWWSE